jgi:acyl-CoA dehydrogenase
MTNLHPASPRRQAEVIGDLIGADKARTTGFQARAAAAAAVAAQYADSVDAAGHFPQDAIDAIRVQRLLGAMVPEALGGEGASITDIAGICYRLGAACSSTAMIYAMHQVKVACVVRHGRGNAWRDETLRTLAARQLLLASSTTEGTNGGNIRSSDAAVVRTAEGFTYERDASVISYGEHADGLVTTARRAPDAPSSDQVLLFLLRENYSLERRQGWETLGMRGTCSRGFRVAAAGRADQILDEPYANIHMRTMMPVAHLLWSSAWAGIAAAAVERARLYTRNALAQSNGNLPPGATHLTRAKRSLNTLVTEIRSALATWEKVADDQHALASTDFQTSMNLLKVDVSEMAVDTTLSAMRACGLAGYRNDSPFSIGRLLRDALSSPIMINNERILAGVGQTALLGQAPGLVAG